MKINKLSEMNNRQIKERIREIDNQIRITQSKLRKRDLWKYRNKLQKELLKSESCLRKVDY